MWLARAWAALALYVLVRDGRPGHLPPDAGRTAVGDEFALHQVPHDGARRRAAGAQLSTGGTDPRIVKGFGWMRATRADELPQLFNVIRGEMSLVGPRPERPELVAEIERRVPGYTLRNELPPGLTGLAQIHGRYATDAEYKLGYDLQYMVNWSPVLDLQILAQTVWVVAHPPCLSRNRSSRRRDPVARRRGRDARPRRGAHLGQAVAAITDQDYPGELDVWLAIAPSTTAPKTSPPRSPPPTRVHVVANPAGSTPPDSMLRSEASDRRRDRPRRRPRRAERRIHPPGRRHTQPDGRRQRRRHPAGGRRDDVRASSCGRRSPAGSAPEAAVSGSAARRARSTPSTSACSVARRSRRSALFDERLVRNQDYELNIRLRDAGGMVWFDPTLSATYRPRGQSARPRPAVLRVRRVEGGGVAPPPPIAASTAGTAADRHRSRPRRRCRLTARQGCRPASCRLCDRRCSGDGRGGTRPIRALAGRRRVVRHHPLVVVRRIRQTPARDPCP